MIAVFVACLSLYELAIRATHRHSFLKGLTKITPSHWGMLFAHVGVAVVVWGIAFSQNYSIERDVRMVVGETVDVAGYDFKLEGIENANGPNYVGGHAKMLITKDGKY